MARRSTQVPGYNKENMPEPVGYAAAGIRYGNAIEQFDLPVRIFRVRADAIAKEREAAHDGDETEASADLVQSKYPPLTPVYNLYAEMALEAPSG